MRGDSRHENGVRISRKHKGSLSCAADFLVATSSERNLKVGRTSYRQQSFMLMRTLDTGAEPTAGLRQFADGTRDHELDNTAASTGT